MSEAIELTLDQFSFTQEQHSAYSHIIKEIAKHKLVIQKAKTTAKESPSETMRRAIAGVEYHKKMLLNHDKELEERIEKTVRRLREDAEEARSKKKTYLADAEKKLADLESVKTRMQVASEIELEALRKKLENMNLPRMGPPLPKTHTKKKICPCGKSCEDIDKCLMTFKSPAELAMEKKVKKEIEEEAEETQQPPFTPFGGLPPPDPPRQVKKAVKTIPPGRILYAAPVEVI